MPFFVAKQRARCVFATKHDIELRSLGIWNGTEPGKKKKRIQYVPILIKIVSESITNGPKPESKKKVVSLLRPWICLHVPPDHQRRVSNITKSFRTSITLINISLHYSFLLLSWRFFFFLFYFKLHTKNPIINKKIYNMRCFFFLLIFCFCCMEFRFFALLLKNNPICKPLFLFLFICRYNFFVFFF